MKKYFIEKLQDPIPDIFAIFIHIFYIWIVLNLIRFFLSKSSCKTRNVNCKELIIFQWFAGEERRKTVERKEGREERNKQVEKE